MQASSRSNPVGEEALSANGWIRLVTASASSNEQFVIISRHDKPAGEVDQYLTNHEVTQIFCNITIWFINGGDVSS